MCCVYRQVCVTGPETEQPNRLCWSTWHKGVEGQSHRHAERLHVTPGWSTSVKCHRYERRAECRRTGVRMAHRVSPSRAGEEAAPDADGPEQEPN